MFGATQTEVLKVKDMHCAHCQKTVETALKAVKGVKRVEVSLEAGTAQVTAAAGKTDRAALCAAVAAAGFEVE